MSALDALIVAATHFAGSTLLADFALAAIRRGLPARFRRRLEVAQGRAAAAIAEMRPFRFPGIRLVDPRKGLFAGEVAALACAALVMSTSSAAARLPLALCAAAPVGAATAWLSIRDASRRRVGELRRALPTASFLLSLLLEAGMGSQAALREIVSALPKGPLAGELAELSRARALGLPREEAIERSRRRVPLDDYRLFLNLVEQGERLGVGLSQALRELSHKMMEGHEQRAEALAQRAAVKLLFPLAAFIFPAVFLVILSPVILSLIEYLGGN